MKQFTVREARQRRRMRQDDLAAATGLDQTTISNYETGRTTNPTINTVRRLAAALGLKPTQLLFEAAEKHEGAAA